MVYRESSTRQRFGKMGRESRFVAQGIEMLEVKVRSIMLIHSNDCLLSTNDNPNSVVGA